VIGVFGSLDLALGSRVDVLLLLTFFGDGDFTFGGLFFTFLGGDYFFTSYFLTGTAFFFSTLGLISGSFTFGGDGSLIFYGLGDLGS
jgi:hypothetical protein